MHTWKIIIIISIGIFLLPSDFLADETPDIEQGIRLFDAKQYKEARSYFEDLSKKYHKNAEIAYHLGKSCIATGEYKNAVALLEKAVDLDNTKAEYNFVLGVAYSRYINEVGMFRKMGIAGKIKNAMTAAADMDETHISAQIAVISFYLSAPGILGGDLDEAIKHMEVLKRHYPNRVFAVEGNIAEKQEEYEKAEKLYRQAVDQNRDPINVLSLANYLSRIEQTDEAIALFNEYLSMELNWRDTSKALVYYILSTVYVLV